MTHTPGPWKATFTSITARGVRAERGFVCFLPKPMHYSGQDERYENELEENHANALVLAAAPDLLEACEAILAWCGTGDGKYFLPLTPPWKAGLLAAIARAKGES